MGRLAIHAHDRLRTAETDQQPATILQLELKTICSDKIGHFQAPKGLRVGTKDSLLAGFAISRKGCVDSVVVMLANFVEKHLEQIRWFLVCLDHEIQEIQARQNAIPLWNIATEGVPAALFTANHGICFQHLWRDVFESHACF